MLVRTYAWMVLLGRNGVLNRLLVEYGIVSDPLPLLHNLTGVLIGMVHVLLPYMVLPIYGAVRRLDPSVVAAARGLGASPWRLFWRIYLPLSKPALAVVAILAFEQSWGDFLSPLLYINDTSRYTLPLGLYSLITGDDVIQLGIPPGPAYRELLDRVRDAQLEKRINTRDDAARLIRTLNPES